MRILAVGGLLLFYWLAFPFAANAQLQAPVGSLQALTACNFSHFYTAQSGNAPPPVAAIFSQTHVPIVIRTCTDLENNAHYFVREPALAQPGICRIEEQEIFRGGPKNPFPIDHLEHGTIVSDDLSGWTWVPPAQWRVRMYRPVAKDFASLNDRPCPPGNDKAYIPVDHVTDGMLKNFDRLWQTAITSPREFDRVFAHAHVIETLDPSADGLTLAAFKKAVFGAASERPVLSSMECAQSSDCESVVGNAQSSWEIDFDVTENGLAITGIALLPEI